MTAHAAGQALDFFNMNTNIPQVKIIMAQHEETVSLSQFHKGAF
jgi:hypothetical protein